MNYQTALKNLDKLVNYEKVAGYDYDLGVYRKFLQDFGSPQKRLKNVILVAGTKGKGSVCAILESILRHCGFKTGLYSSPHLFKVNERIKFNNCEISNKDFARLTSRVVGRIEKTKGARSFFEAVTAIAFLYFLEKKVDFTILEVGLGGRLDATNVSDPIVTAITTIGYDHTNLLGKTLKKIAWEKAGIIRAGCPVVVGNQQKAVLKLLGAVAKKRKAPFISVGKPKSFKILNTGMGGSNIKVGGKVVSLPLVGLHQLGNLFIVFAVLKLIKAMGYRLPFAGIKKGLGALKVSGRIQVYTKRPLIILDGAHNPDSFSALYSVMKNLKKKKLIIVFGISQDKNARIAYRKIFPLASEIVLTRVDFSRARRPDEILKDLKPGAQKKVKLSSSVGRALKYVSTRIKANDCLLIIGSFYVVGEALKELPKYYRK